jgi:hypothetical protein
MRVDDVRLLPGDQVVNGPPERNDQVFHMVAKAPHVVRAPMRGVHDGPSAGELGHTGIRKCLQKTHLVASAGKLSREVGHVLLSAADGRIAVGID